MAHKEDCSGCVWSHDCKGVYAALGRAEGPSVVGKVFTAFLLPLAVFIVSLVIVDRLLSDMEIREASRLVISTSVAAVTGFAAVLLAASFARRRWGCKADRQVSCEETHEA